MPRDGQLLAFSYRLPGARAEVAVLPLAFPFRPKMVAGAPTIISIFQSRRMRNGEWQKGYLPAESAP